MNREDIYNYIENILCDEFEIDRERISTEADLYTDLHIDSIDAVDLLVYLKEYTGKKIAPEQFRDVRTIDDVIGAIMAQ
jgi:acyl carrier protein